MSRWTERVSTAAVIVGITACDPLATNNSQATVASISDLMIPAPSVVVGELMKDSLGNDAPLSLAAFDPEGRLLVNQPIFISVFDPSIHVDQLGYVHGVIRDTVGARLVAGAGSLQTPQSRIIVSVRPELATKSTAPTAINFDIATPDTSNQTNWSPLLSLTLTNTATLGAQGFIVEYTVIRSPAPTTTGVPTVYLGDEAGKATRRDTTDHFGTASRRIVLRQQAFGDAALIAGTKTDTVIVRATALYGGVNISGTPVNFTIPLKRKP